MSYTAYFDSGTTNSRLYLLNEKALCVYRSRCAVGAKDSAKAKNGEVQTKALYELYSSALQQMCLTDTDVELVCVSGNVTSRYGVHEVEHLLLPQSTESFAKGLFTFYEEKYFKRNITLVPGVKQVCDDFELTGLARGEEIELFGMFDSLKRERSGETVAVAMPGSHTHIAYLKDDTIAGMCSNITGEIFYALKEETVLAPVLEADGPLYAEWVRKGVSALKRYGFTRALYLTHTMRILERYTPGERRSFAEGVIFGDIAQSVDVFTGKMFPDCDTLLIAAEREIGELYKTVFSMCSTFKTVELLPPADEPWALMGFRKLFGKGV